jgi:hypothetical protein
MLFCQLGEIRAVGNLLFKVFALLFRAHAVFQ